MKSSNPSPLPPNTEERFSPAVKEQKSEGFQYRKCNIGAAKMRPSILCVRDDFYIFYIGILRFSSP